MKPEDLAASAVPGSAPPQALAPCVKALWWDKCGDWNRAHEAVAEDEGSRDAAWVHAYLHRQEGDLDNARYWYRRAGRPVSTVPLEAEWHDIAAALLGGR